MRKEEKEEKREETSLFEEVRSFSLSLWACFSLSLSTAHFSLFYPAADPALLKRTWGESWKRDDDDRRELDEERCEDTSYQRF